MLAAELQQVLNTVSQNQLQGLRTLQEDTNKYIHQLTKLISASPKSPVTGVPKPAQFSGHADEDFNLWLDNFKAIASFHLWSQDDCAKLLYIFLTGPALCYFQGLDVEVRDNFDAATSALKERFDDATIRNSLHLQLHNLKQGLTESVTDFCFALERKFIRLNVTAEFYKLLVFMDGVLPHLRFEIHKCAPQTYAEAKTMALNLEIALRTRSHPTVSTVGQSSFVESQSLEHKINNLQHEINSLKQSLSDFETKNFSRRGNFSKSRTRGNSKQMHKRTSTRDLVCYNCNKKGHIARKCRSKVANLGRHSSSEDIDYLSNLRPQQTQLVDTVPLLTMDMNTFSVSVQLYGIPFIALIDTGSSISAISQDTWMQISHLASVKLDPAGRSGFHTASGTPLKANGTFQNSYQIGNNFYPQKTYVIANLLHPVLLGRDFLSKYALSINFLTSHLTLGNNPDFVEHQDQIGSLNVIDFSHKNDRFQNFLSEVKQTFPNTLRNSEPDLNDLSDTVLHDLENKHYDFQSVDSPSRYLSSQFKSNFPDEKTSQSCSSCSRISSLKNVILNCVLLAISFMVLFQVLTDSQVFHSPYMDTANRIHFSLPQLSRTPSFDTIDSHKQVNISSWQHIIIYIYILFTAAFSIIDLQLLATRYSAWTQLS